MKFYLGTHQPGWLWNGSIDGPLFVSRTRLSRYKTLRPSLAEWALDSGGFTEIQKHGRWTITPKQYIAEVRRFTDEIGNLAWAAPMDWMCEPVQLAKTRKTSKEHQWLTLINYMDLMEEASDLPFVPVLQGWDRDDYMRCWEMYDSQKIYLEDHALVGVGSVCRRQGTFEALRILRSLQPLKLHGFGIKTTGLAMYGQLLASSDSLAWSLNARKHPPLEGCEGLHKTCANCHKWAHRWRERVLATIADDPKQLRLWEAA